MSGRIDNDIDFTIGQVYQDPSLLDGEDSGDDSDGDNNNDGGGNPPSAGFSKTVNDWRMDSYYESTAPPADTDSTYSGGVG